MALGFLKWVCRLVMLPVAMGWSSHGSPSNINVMQDTTTGTAAFNRTTVTTVNMYS
jgi:hypothetical protein